MIGGNATAQALEDALTAFKKNGLNVSHVAQRYELNPESLRRGLEAIYTQYITAKIQQDSTPRKKDVEALLDPIANQAEKLRSRLNDLPQLLSQHLDFQADEETESLLSRLSMDLRLLREFTKQTTANWMMPKLGENYNNLLLLRLAQLWKLLTGRGATYTTDPLDLGRSGVFLSFVNDVADLLGIDSKGLDKRFVKLKKEHDDLFK